MGGLLARLMTLGAYLCVATVVAALAGVIYLRSSGRLNDDRIDRLLAVAQGIDTKETKSEQAVGDNANETEQPSYEDHEQARELQSHNLEMREQALKSGLDRIRFEQSKVAREKEIYDALENAFDTQLEALRTKALSSGRENVRMIWENIKPKQAKEQILKMLDNQEMNEVVTILSGMPIGKRAKIVSEFKTGDETARLDEVLRLIRSGVPEVNLIDKTRSQVKQP
jgi:stress-induced morphogen